MIGEIDGCRIAGHILILATRMPTQFPLGLVWLRRDLRTSDHPALATALQRCARVHCVFVLDRTILDPLPRDDRRVAWLRDTLQEVDAALRALAGTPQAGLIVLHGTPEHEIPALAEQLRVAAVFCATDYEPQARQRDLTVGQALQAQGRTLVQVKDHVVFEPHEVRTRVDTPYTVFTPYLRSWLARLELQSPPLHSLSDGAGVLADRPAQYAQPVPALQDFGFTAPPRYLTPGGAGMAGAQALLQDFIPRMEHYQAWRDFPAVKGPSYLGVHLRFGTISIRTLVRLALQEQAHGSAGASTWLSELAWRDFYFQILYHFPHVAHAAFKPAYDAIEWESGPHANALFAAWCEGRTGYPLVDAAMLQLNQSGYMHNRLRMVAGSFLVKHLGIDWRWGERYFAERLNDFDLAANNGGWQWVSSSGCDAQPYFRIFNPIRQSEKFDAEGGFIRRYLPVLKELDARSIHAPWLASPVALASAGLELGRNYPHPIVDHASARARTLQRYAIAGKAATTD